MKFLIALPLFVLFCGQAPAAQKCDYTLDKSSAEINWTAFKTTQKVAVNGVFKMVDISGATHARSLKKLMEGVKVDVHSDSSDSKNPGRDKTVHDNFFAKLADGKISGQLKDVSESGKTAQLALTFNGQQHMVPMTYVYENEKVTATGSFDLLQFAAGPAHDALHKACEKLHAGSDGVAKTWTDVTVTLKGKITEKCK